MNIYDLIIEVKKITMADQIRMYTDLSRNLSRELYKHHANGTIPPEFIMQDNDSKGQHHLPTLDKISFRKLTKNTTLYSGIRHNPLDFVDSNFHLHTPAFMSTSTSWGIASSFARKQAGRKDKYSENGEIKHTEPAHILEINAKRGQYAGNLSIKSVLKDENEYLLPRNTVLQINPNPEINPGSNRETYVWECSIVSQKSND